MPDRMPKSKAIAPKVPEGRTGDLHIRDAISSNPAPARSDDCQLFRAGVGAILRPDC